MEDKVGLTLACLNIKIGKNDGRGRPVILSKYYNIIGLWEE